ncbi:hypothetical protein ADUPG1_012301 [Aduncisulcus paluster]|uniref:Signal recognition particle receptor subunit beta n=1 Tax=Aduncisulcus paluster TaxID=2918883 RepID=A0ABQ5K2R9_9EUKA|nr:hypothetical protein ADUPG1_012301 [Aduncisulcus paluster]
MKSDLYILAKESKQASGTPNEHILFVAGLEKAGKSTAIQSILKKSLKPSGIGIHHETFDCSTYDVPFSQINIMDINMHHKQAATYCHYVCKTSPFKVSFLLVVSGEQPLDSFRFLSFWSEVFAKHITSERVYSVTVLCSHRSAVPIKLRDHFHIFSQSLRSICFNSLHRASLCITDMTSVDGNIACESLLLYKLLGAKKGTNRIGKDLGTFILYEEDEKDTSILDLKTCETEMSKVFK